MNKLFNKYQPDIYSVISQLINQININLTINNIDYLYIPQQFSFCTDISIDYAILELLPSGSIKMIIYDNIWSDIGTFGSIYELVLKDQSGINLSANIINYKSYNCYIDSNKLVLLNNVNNLAIIDTDGVLLISDLQSTQDIKKIYELTKKDSNNNIRFNNIDYRPWGFYEVLAGNDDSGFKIKKISVYPGKRLSLQSHKHRREQWTCISGSGQAQIEDQIVNLEINKVVEIEIGQKHRLINNSEQLFEIIEIQMGIYLGEDDIIRYEDDFGR